MAIGAAFLTGALGMSLYWFGVHGGDGTSARSTGDSALFPTTIDPDDPTQPLLTDGVLVTLPQAQAARSFPIYRPQNSVASDRSLAQVWIGESEVALRYSSGLRVYIRTWPPGKDPAATYATQAQDLGVGDVVQVNGNPAWVAEADAIGPGNPRYTFVDMSIGNIQVLLAARMPLDDLTQIASSVRP